MTRQTRAIGVDIGGSKISVGLVCESGRIEGHRSFPTAPTKGFERAMDRVVAAVEDLLAAAGLEREGLVGIGIGWWLFARDADTQAERDRLRIPGLYPLLENKYYLDDFYLAIVGFIKGPLARFIDWFNSHVIDAVINGAGLVGVWLGRAVYGVDQKGIDGAVNGLAGAAGASGAVLRKAQTGRVQQYAAAFVLGAVVLVIGFVFVL